MSLGGYKFAGYKCTKASGMSNIDLALLIHKTRLKAFTEACSKAGANWHFCKNGGTHDFEGNTGVIYKIIGVSEDFASYFQYGNEDKYFCIITCPEITDDIFHDGARGVGYYEGYPTNRYLWTYRTMFHCASVSPLDADFFIKQDRGGVANYPSGALPIIPISTFYLNTTNNSRTASDNGTWFSYPRDGYYDCFGYAVKGSNIITFAVQNKDGGYISSGQIFVTVIGFDAMKLSSQSDTYNVFHVSLNMPTTTVNECTYVKKNNDWHITKCQQTLKSDGTLYAESGRPSSLFLNTMSLASFVYGVSTDTPYSSMRLVTHENADSDMRTTTPLLNSDGITSKGEIDIDLMACNVTNGYASLKACGAYANGNYLLACKDYGGYQQYYVGWDPSNPDITLDSSWEEYVEPMPAYTEKTLYLVSETQNFQTSVTKNFTGTKTPVYQLYEDSNLTTPSTYESNKSYETGRYVDNVWVPWTKLSDFPASTTSDYSSRMSSRLAVDNSGNLYLWFLTNYTSPLTATVTQIIVRVYNS